MAEDTKRWRRVKVMKNVVYLDNVPLEHKWVRWNRDFEDGRYIYRKGQVIEIEDKEKWMFYLEAGHVTPCEPQKNEKPKYSGNRALYLMLDSLATSTACYVEGKQYELPEHVGTKFVKRGLAEKIKDLGEIDRSAKTETAVTRRG